MKTPPPHEELGPRIPLHIMRIKVAPPQLDVQPVLARGRPIITILRVVEERGLGDLPLVGRKQQDVRTTGIHFIGLARVDRLLLHIFDLRGTRVLRCLHFVDGTRVHERRRWVLF